MKTNIHVQKTENRKPGKSTMFIFALMVSFLCVSPALSARKFQRQSQLNPSFSPTALVMEALQIHQMMNYQFIPEAHLVERNSALPISTVETSAERNLEIESWMTNENHFLAPASLMEAEREECLFVEGWMLTGENFLESSLPTDRDKILDVEPWMVDESTWAMSANM